MLVFVVSAAAAAVMVVVVGAGGEHHCGVRAPHRAADRRRQDIPLLLLFPLHRRGTCPDATTTSAADITSSFRRRCFSCVGAGGWCCFSWCGCWCFFCTFFFFSALHRLSQPLLPTRSRLGCYCVPAAAKVGSIIGTLQTMYMEYKREVITNTMIDRCVGDPLAPGTCANTSGHACTPLTHKPPPLS